MEERILRHLAVLCMNLMSEKIWLEGVDINREIAPAELSKFNLIGGAIGQLTGQSSIFEDSYVQGGNCYG